MIRRTTFSAGALLCVLSMAVPTPGHAARLAYAGEGRDIAASLDVPRRCVAIRISTVSRRWSAVRPTNRGGCFAADGVLVMRRVSAHTWRVRYQGPNESWAPCSDVKHSVPVSIAYDLRICGRGPQ